MNGYRSILVLVVAAWSSAAGGPLAAAEAGNAAASTRLPRMFPDYGGIVLPPNIAPLNFRIEEPGRRYQVTIRSTRGQSIELTSKDAGVIIPLPAWKALLRANAGEPLHVDVAVQTAAGEWTRFDTVTNTIARESIDGYLVYRLLKPLYNVYRTLGICQRHLETYQETEVLQNKRVNDGCLNCHAFLNHSPKTAAFHVRSEGTGNPMILIANDQAAKVLLTAGYMSWHPSGRLIAFSRNKLSLFFHTTGECRDVFDAESNLGMYRVDSNALVVPRGTAQPDVLETWPSWSPDGRWLYYCSAPKRTSSHFREVRYSLMRVRYDLESDTWGEPETMLSAEQTGLSIAQPRVSPDGKSLLFCMFRYGSFPIYQPSSDLYLMDLETRRHRRLEINSDQADTWHCWSSNGRWVVFSSKRRDGLFARPYFSYVDEQRKFHKPFVLPQEDPAFYDSFIKTYNVPELITEPIKAGPQELTRAIVAPMRVLTPMPDPSQPHGATHTEAQGAPPKPGYDESGKPPAMGN